jgi:DUF971 family protein
MSMRPTEITLHQKSRNLELTYEDGKAFSLPAEFLRVLSPSAEVRGHTPGSGKLQIGKENVAIKDVEPIGNYAIRIIFDDNHDSGIYDWDYLYDLGVKQDAYWDDYLQQLKAAGHERKAPDTDII